MTHTHIFSAWAEDLYIKDAFMWITSKIYFLLIIKFNQKSKCFKTWQVSKVLMKKQSQKPEK